METSQKYRVVIIGAGFAGLWAAKRLAQEETVEVLLIDRNNYHTFLPLLYQVAAAELEPGQIGYPIRGIFRRCPRVKPVLAEVRSVDCDKRIVYTDGLEYPYDALIVGAGSATAFYGVPGAEEHCFTLKSLEDAVRLRNRLLSCFEMAGQIPPEKRPEGMLRVAVIGGGPTGVEYAGALSELMRTPLAKDFPELASAEYGVTLVDGGQKLLNGFPDRLRDYTASRLEKMGVEVRLGSPVAAVTPEGVLLKDGSRIAAHTVVWVAGVCGADLSHTLGLPVGKGGRVEVTPTLQAAGHPELFVVGDQALVEGQNSPAVGPNAIQQGRLAAENMLRAMRGEETLAYNYHNKGSMVTIGRSAAVAHIGKYSFTGFFAWVLWLFVHLALLIGFRNRLFVFISWAWDYLFFERAVRLILPRDPSVSCACTEEGQGSPPSSAPAREPGEADRK